MRKILWGLIATAAATVGGAAWAHGPQIQITGDTGKIVTRSLHLDGPYSDQLSAEKSVYVMPIRENLGAWYSRPNGTINTVLQTPEFYSGPGIAFGYGYDPNQPASIQFAVGSQINLAFTAGLLRWDGAGFIDPGVPQVEAFRGGFAAPTATARTSDAGPFASVSYGSVSYPALDGHEVHTTMRFRMLGDGTSTAVECPDGVYLLSLQFTSTQAGLAASDPFYFVLNKNAPPATVQAATASLNVAPALVQVVPEPGALGLAAIALSWIGLRMRRGRRSLNNEESLP